MLKKSFWALAFNEIEEMGSKFIRVKSAIN